MNSTEPVRPFSYAAVARTGARSKELVAETLALRILGGAYAPGEQLPNEAALLGEFGVSRTCLREGLQLLSAKGLVRSRAKLGTFVCEKHRWNFLDADLLRWRQRVIPRPVFLRELFAMRRIIEPESAALAAENATPEVLSSLQAALLDMARGNGSHTPDTTEADVRFHLLLLSAGGNALLSGLGACMEEALRASISVSSHPRFALPLALDKHVAVFEAVAQRDPAAARARMVALLDITDESLALAKYGDGIDQLENSTPQSNLS